MRLNRLTRSHRRPEAPDSTMRAASPTYLALSTALLLAVSAPAQSAIVRADFAGTLSQCSSSCSYFSAGTGSAFGGFIIYDTSDATDANPANSALGAYFGQIVDAELHFGTYTADAMSAGSGDNAIYVANNSGSPAIDAFNAFRRMTPPPIPGSPVGPTALVNVQFYDATASTLSSDALPSSFVAAGSGGLGYLVMSDYSVFGTVTSATFSVVPLPPAAPLLLTGLAALLPATRRRRRPAT